MTLRSGWPLLWEMTSQKKTKYPDHQRYKQDPSKHNCLVSDRFTFLVRWGSSMEWFWEWIHVLSTGISSLGRFKPPETDVSSWCIPGRKTEITETSNQYALLTYPSIPSIPHFRCRKSLKSFLNRTPQIPCSEDYVSKDVVATRHHFFWPGTRQYIGASPQPLASGKLTKKIKKLLNMAMDIIDLPIKKLIYPWK